MHITLEADYAVRIVVYLATENRRVDANTISEATGVSLRFALKILRNLVANNIVKSFKGTQGGYELNQPPSEITLKEVLETVEGEYRFSRCIGPDSTCNHPKDYNCKVQKIFGKITNEVKNMLDEVTIESLC
jgi:Rrf2 family protein